MTLFQRFCSIVLSLLFSYTLVFSSEIDESQILSTLKEGHPRLILRQEDIPRLQKLIQDDPTARRIYASIKKDADKTLRQPTVEYKIVGPRLLTQSRRCLDRVYKLSLVYLLEKKQDYLQRAIQEVQAAARFPDWNPSHFLDTAEMTHAFAIAYDWLYADLGRQDKKRIRQALIDKGLKAYLKGYEDKRWFIKSQHNWNQVCHGGIGIGALALADESPATAKKVLSIAIQHLPLALQHYAPDGGWNEGPGYWHYATRYTVYFLASLETALGKDFGLSEFPGFDNAGQFRIHFEGPTGYSFNYADAGARVRGTHEMYWLATHFNRPEYAWFQRQDTSYAHPLDLIWYTRKGTDPQRTGLPLDIHYRGIDVVFFRSAWNDPNALFVGFKGGDNKANHSHLDLGSFVLDALGKRWVTDLGGDNYNLPAYFGKKRWTYYRLINKSHNTLVLDDQNQDPKAEAPITEFHQSPGWSYAVTDLSKAYHVKQLHRAIGILHKKSILIQDELISEKPVDIVWGIMTPATIQTQKNIATLELGGKYLQVRILEPGNAVFDVVDANPPKPQRQNPGIKRLVIRQPKPVKTLSLSVQLTPYSDKNAPPSHAAERLQIAKWKTR